MLGMRCQRHEPRSECGREARPRLAASPQGREIADEIVVTRRRPALADTDEEGHRALCGRHVAASR